MASSEGEIDSSVSSMKKEAEFKETSIHQRFPTNKEGDNGVSEGGPKQISNLDNLSRRSSSRKAKPTEKVQQSYDRNVRGLFSLFTLFSLVCSSTVSAMSNLKPANHLQRAGLHAERLSIMHDGSINSIHHAFASMTGSDNGVYTLKEMLKQEDRADFIAAMLVEIHDHEKRNHWTMIPRSEIPEGAKTILSIWSFKRKRYPDGRILKHKARLCAHGGMQT